MKISSVCCNVSLITLVNRIALAVVFIYHGYGKVFEGGHGQIAKMMVEQGAPIPEVLGWVAGITEFFGGIFILAGLMSRFWAMGLVILMAVAIKTVHWENGFSIQDHGYEYCLVLLLLALGVVLSGPGTISIDQVMMSRRKKASKE
ncbi:MAG: DoxX family protein [Phycisphaerae bacterium]|nr:DoxX family protein [Phycisphaerae bacterium]